MSRFNAIKKFEGGKLTLAIEGSVDEDAVLSGITFDQAQTVELDLEKITSINSCGIREWIKWLKGAPVGSKIIYRRCPKVIVDQINMVSGFLPDGAEVESFFVPYFNESTGNEKMVLFSKGKEFSTSGVNIPGEVKDDNGEVMEMDVIESKYFKFINKK